MQRSHLRAIAVLGTLLLTAPAVAQVSVAWSVVTGGAVASNGADLRLAGSVGQPVVGLSGALRHGFWQASRVGTATGLEEVPVRDLPVSFALHQAYPNPFNPETTFRYDVPREGTVRIVVYDALGRRVRTLVTATSEPGEHRIRWDGLGDGGVSAASGLYLVRMEADGFVGVRRVLLVR